MKKPSYNNAEKKAALFGKKIYSYWKFILYLLVIMCVPLTALAVISHRWFLLESWIFVFVHIFTMFLCILFYYGPIFGSIKLQELFKSKLGRAEIESICFEYRIVFIIEGIAPIMLILLLLQ